jgi:hypothetical protein
MPTKRKRHWPADLSFIQGAVRYKDLVYVCVCDDELLEEKTPHSSYTAYDRGDWTDAGDRKWHTVSMSVVKQPKEQMIALGEYGKAWFYGNKDQHEEVIKDAKQSAKERGSLRVVRAIDGVAYAAGMDRQVWRRDGANLWTCIDATMRPGPREDVVGFEGIDGFSSKDIYAGGWNGEIRHWDGKKWKEVDSPTNAILTNLVCGDAAVYAIGRLGLVVRGRGSRWKILKQDVDEDLWGAAWFKGKLWVASLTQLYTLEKDELVPVEFKDGQPETCKHLSAADGILWSIGRKDLFEYNGKKWTRIE